MPIDYFTLKIILSFVAIFYLLINLITKKKKYKLLHSQFYTHYYIRYNLVSKR